MIRFIIKHPQFVSAAAALLALIFSIFIYSLSRQRERPIERPILYIKELKAENSTLRIFFEISNFGERPASNISFLFGSTIMSALNKFQFSGGPRLFSNTLFPGADSTLIIPFNMGEPKFLYIQLNYRNALRLRKRYREEFWYCWQEGKNISEMEGEQIEALKPIILKLLEKRPVDNLESSTRPMKQSASLLSFLKNLQLRHFIKGNKFSSKDKLKSITFWDSSKKALIAFRAKESINIGDGFIAGIEIIYSLILACAVVNIADIIHEDFLLKLSNNWHTILISCFFLLRFFFSPSQALRILGNKATGWKWTILPFDGLYLLAFSFGMYFLFANIENYFVFYSVSFVLLFCDAVWIFLILLRIKGGGHSKIWMYNNLFFVLMYIVLSPNRELAFILLLTNSLTDFLLTYSDYMHT